ncbi:MAG: hypothetical protein CM1200mP20_00220 [Pseudomonadota bacterium]|nr:MAG: hypothetical protein CM1200mP20_00220 [Pseudomonadota bacterium]
MRRFPPAKRGFAQLVVSVPFRFAVNGCDDVVTACITTIVVGQIIDSYPAVVTQKKAWIGLAAEEWVMVPFEVPEVVVGINNGNVILHDSADLVTAQRVHLQRQSSVTTPVGAVRSHKA